MTHSPYSFAVPITAATTIPDMVVYIYSVKKSQSINRRLRLSIGFGSRSGPGAVSLGSPQGGHNRLSLIINSQSGDSQTCCAKRQIAVDSVAGVLCIFLLSRCWFFNSLLPDVPRGSVGLTFFPAANRSGFLAGSVEGTFD